MSKLFSGICAAIMISIGGTVFLACDIRYIGAILFSVALLCICLRGYSLFTGKIGFIPEKHGREEFSVLLLGLLGNAVSTIICGFAIKLVYHRFLRLRIKLMGEILCILKIIITIIIITIKELI